jgi:hypothetical protein
MAISCLREIGIVRLRAPKVQDRFIEKIPGTSIKVANGAYLNSRLGVYKIRDKQS